MNNINSQELTRAVVTDSGAARSDRQAATRSSNSGKVMPEQSGAPQEVTKPNREAINQGRAARVERAVAQLNDYVQSLQRDLRFSVDDSLGRTVVRVIDRQSQEVIRQIPNETALRLARNLKDQHMEEIRNEAQAPTNLNLIDTRI